MPFLQHVKILTILIKMVCNKIQIEIQKYNMIQFEEEILSVKNDEDDDADDDNADNIHEDEDDNDD